VLGPCDGTSLSLATAVQDMVYNEHPNRKHMAELNARFAQGVDSILTGDTVIDFPKSVAVLPPPLNYAGNNTKGVAKDRPSPTDLLAEISDKNRRRHLFGLKKLGWIDFVSSIS